MSDQVIMNIRIDSELKKEAEAILADFDLTLEEAINMFLREIVRDRESLLPFIYEKSPLGATMTVEEQLIEAEAAQARGYIGRSAEEVIKDMRAMVEQSK